MRTLFIVLIILAVEILIAYSRQGG